MAAVQKNAATAVLAALGRVVVGAVLLAVFLAAMLWAWAGPQGWPLVAWLLAVCAVVVAAGLCALPKGDGDG
jgi:hypothetical protein